MKTLKILFAAVIIAGFATSAMGQTDADILTKANVQAEINIGEDVSRNLNFGTVALDRTVTMDPETGETAFAGSSPIFGAINLSAGAGQSLDVSWTYSNLTQVGVEEDADELTFTPMVSQEENTITADDFGGETFTEGSLTVHTSGNHMFYIGGTLIVPDNVAVGDYQGDFTLTVAYN